MRKRAQRQERELTPYQQKLLDPRWQKKRLEILQRDEWTCQRCEAEQHTLHVHHRWYFTDIEPWDVPTHALETLCDTCHEEESREGKEAEKCFIATLRGLGIPWWAFYKLTEDIQANFPPMRSENAIEFCALISALLPHISAKMGFIQPGEAAIE